MRKKMVHIMFFIFTLLFISRTTFIFAVDNNIKSIHDMSSNIKCISSDVWKDNKDWIHLQAVIIRCGGIKYNYKLGKISKRIIVYLSNEIIQTIDYKYLFRDSITMDSSKKMNPIYCIYYINNGKNIYFDSVIKNEITEISRIILTITENMFCDNDVIKNKFKFFTKDLSTILKNLIAESCIGVRSPPF